MSVYVCVMSSQAVKNAAVSVDHHTGHTETPLGESLVFSQCYSPYTAVGDSTREEVELVSYKEAEHPLTSETETTQSPSTEDLLEETSGDPLEPVSMKSVPHRRGLIIKLLLCRGGVVLVCVCLMVLSGVLAGVFRREDLEALCDNCTCSNTTNCVCTMASYTPHTLIAPTPYPL